MFHELRSIAARPEPFSAYTADVLWTDPHISEQMLTYHLDGTVDISSRRTESIEASVAWTSATFGLGPGVSVLDLGCGPGSTRTAGRLRRRRDRGRLSRRSIAYARADAATRGLAVDYVHADYLTTGPPGPSTWSR